MIGKIYMSVSDFSETDQDFLISMPYRAGIWMSYADTNGGMTAIKREIQALAKIIQATAENFCESSFVQELAEKTVQKRDRWDSWQKNTDNFPSECQRAIEMLSGNISPEDMNSFKSTLLEVAISVARAYNERFQEQDFGKKMRTYASIWLERTLARINGVGDDKMTAYDVINISPDEESALMDLASALRADIREMAEDYRHRLSNEA